MRPDSAPCFSRICRLIFKLCFRNFAGRILLVLSFNDRILSVSLRGHDIFELFVGCFECVGIQGVHPLPGGPPHSLPPLFAFCRLRALSWRGGGRIRNGMRVVEAGALPPPSWAGSPPAPPLTPPSRLPSPFGPYLTPGEQIAPFWG